MFREIICIACPRGCKLTVRESGDEITIEGNCCKKGIDYGNQEVLQPLRMLTTTVKTTRSDYPRLPVRLSTEIPKAELMNCMKAINRVIVKQSCSPGDVVMAGIAGDGVNLIATGELSYDA